MALTWKEDTYAVHHHDGAKTLPCLIGFAGDIEAYWAGRYIDGDWGIWRRWTQVAGAPVEEREFAIRSDADSVKQAAEDDLAQWRALLMKMGIEC